MYALDKTHSRKKTLVEKVRILKQEDDNTPHYALSNNLSLIREAQNLRESRGHAWFLSPFDNVVWDRKRVRRLFGADVRLEAIFPPSKRQFGYYAMPVTWNSRIVGRLDPKVDRKTATLTLANLELTLPKQELEDALEAIREELADFMVFHGCERMEIENAKPVGLKRELL